MIRLDDFIKEQCLDADIVLQIHDEIVVGTYNLLGFACAHVYNVVECNDSHVELLSEFLRGPKLCTSFESLRVSLPMKVSHGKTWTDVSNSTDERKLEQKS